MSQAEDAPTSGPYATAAPTYWAAGWRGILPLPVQAKTPVPKGYTGTTGTWPSYPDVQAWTEDKGHGNIALRLPPDVLGVDVDHYGNKPGGAVLADLETRLGTLPATWRTTSRDDGVSGIRLYRIPAGLRWPGVLGPGIETIRHEHRYAVTWPSVHPQGGTYRWITPDGATALGVVPSIDDLPPLPEAWVQHFTRGELATEQAHAGLDHQAAAGWLGTRGSGAPCRRTGTALTNGIAELTTATSRHDAMLSLTNRLIWLAGEGHTGVAAALAQARAAFLQAVAGDRVTGEPEAEWDRMVAGAVDLAAAAWPTPSTDPCDDPFHDILAAKKAQQPATTSTAPTPMPASNATPSSEVAEPARTSWWPRDPGLALDDDTPEPPAAFLRRDDGQALFYPGRVNGLIAPSESGKTWLAIHAIAQAVEEGHRVTFLDFEDTQRGVTARLIAVGIPAELVRSHIAYIGPDEPLHNLLETGRDLHEHMTTWQPALVVLDGVNAAMTLQGLDLVSNKDATVFAQVVLKPLAAFGAAVVYVDHTPKSKDNDTAGGIGAQAKRAMTTGCAIRVEVKKAFGKGQAGTLTLRVDKDRQGDVRGASLPSQNGHWAGTAHITPGDDGTVGILIESPATRVESAAQGSTFRPTKLMSRVSEFVAEADEEPTTNAITEAVQGKKEYVKQALDLLVAEGYVARHERTGRGGKSQVHAHVKHFDEGLDGLLGSGSRSGSQVSPGPTSSGPHRSGSPAPSPYGEPDPLREAMRTPDPQPKTRSGSRIVQRAIEGKLQRINLDTGEIVGGEA